MLNRLIISALTLFALATGAGAESSVEPIPDAVWEAMQGKSFNESVKGCAQRDDLALLTLPYWDFLGEARTGQLIVHRDVANDVRDVFVRLYTDKSYRIERMELIDAYGGNDLASMEANNTSAYNCRKVSGSARLSSHAKGIAIDINPLINPYVWKKGTSPLAGTRWDSPKERTAAKDQPGIILSDSAVTLAFKAIGWGWGGEWKTAKDYQHFSADGR